MLFLVSPLSPWISGQVLTVIRAMISAGTTNDMTRIWLRAERACIPFRLAQIGTDFDTPLRQLFRPRLCAARFSLTDQRTWPQGVRGRKRHRTRFRRRRLPVCASSPSGDPRDDRTAYGNRRFATQIASVAVAKSNAGPEVFRAIARTMCSAMRLIKAPT